MYKRSYIIYFIQQVIRRLILPQCLSCHLPIKADNQIYGCALICKTCRQVINQTQSLCIQCGLPLKTGSIIAQARPYQSQYDLALIKRPIFFKKPLKVCHTCLSAPPIWDRLFCINLYQEPLRHYIHQYKFQRQFWLSSLFASLLAPKIKRMPNMMIPVPLHWFRYCQRGYNQSFYLAQAIQKYFLQHQQTKIPIQNTFVRAQATKSQKSLNLKQREQNTQNAFQLKNRAYLPEHVALVDDIVTTGSTITPICQQLKENGVKKIDIYCICRTQLS